jgi:hypothetical protein
VRLASLLPLPCSPAFNWLVDDMMVASPQSKLAMKESSRQIQLKSSSQMSFEVSSNTPMILGMGSNGLLQLS